MEEQIEELKSPGLMNYPLILMQGIISYFKTKSAIFLT